MLDKMQSVRENTFDSFASPWLCCDNDFIYDELPTIRKMAIKGHITESMKALKMLSNCATPTDNNQKIIALQYLYQCFNQDDSHLLNGKHGYTYVYLVATSYIASSLEELAKAFSPEDIEIIYDYDGSYRSKLECKYIIRILNSLFFKLTAKLGLTDKKYNLTKKCKRIIKAGAIPMLDDVGIKTKTKYHYDFNFLFNRNLLFPKRLYGVIFGIHLYQNYLRYYQNMEFFDYFEAVFTTLSIASHIPHPIHSTLRFLEIASTVNKDIINMFNWYEVTYKKVQD